MTLEEIVNNLKSAGQDYGQLFNNNPRMDATKQFGGRAINNINSAGEGYSQWQRLQDQNFGPNQSVIASGFMHPQKGLSKLADWFTNNVNTAAGLPDPNQQDEASMYAYGPNIDQQAESGLNLAGLLQTGAFASGAAPKSAGGTLGTFIGRNSTGWDATKAAEAEKLLNAGADPAQVWKDHLIGRMPDGKLFSEIDDSLASYIQPKKFGSYLGDTLNGSDVFAKYPKMGYMNVKETPHYSYYDTKTKSIGIRESSKQKISPLLHEVQHAIQDAENWAGGGNPNHMIFDDYLPDTKKRINEYLAILNENPHVQSSIDNLHKEGKINAYHRLTGEAQARATQDRIKMNMQQRRDNYPLAGDRLGAIPLDQLINRYGDNGPSMSMSIKNGQYNKEKKMKEMR